MFTQNMNDFIKMAVQKNARKPVEVSSESIKDGRCDKEISASVNSSGRTIKKNVLSNVNSAIFAMLLQRTTFTFIVVVSCVLSYPTVVSGAEIVSSTSALNKTTEIPVFDRLSIEENAIDDSFRIEVVKPHSPIYIPFVTDAFTKTKDAFFKHLSKASGEFKKLANQTYDTGNSLWDSLLKECVKNPSMSCIQKNVYTYLDDSIGISDDVNVTDGFKFKKNKLAYWKYTEQANKKTEEIVTTTEKGSVVEKKEDIDNEEEDFEDEDEARFSDSPLQEITNAIYDKGVKFFMSHDLELRLPQTFFSGALLRAAPRSLEGGGAVVHLELLPRELENSNGGGRIFFKKIKKYLKNKLLLGLLAVIIVIKLIKLKLFFFLPLLVGVHNAKKFFLKFVLFIFPALSNIFQLCSWYHNNYHSTKFHHHHHKISHLHHSLPHPHPPVDFGRPFVAPGVQDGIFQHNSPDYILSGPGLGPEFLGGDIHRNAIASFSPRPDDAGDINSWGLGPAVSHPAPGVVQLSPGATYGTGKPYFGPLYDEQRYVRQAAAAEIASRAKPQGVIPQGPPLPTYAQARRPGTVIIHPENDALLQEAQRQEELRVAQSQITEVLRQHAEQKLVEEQQKMLQATSYNTAPSAQGDGSLGIDTAPVYDSFYSPILQRVDQVFVSMAFHDEPCRERLVCSMYKDPQRFSPHSNLISNELSRDASELQKPAAGSLAAVRFYRYVQAARDGQDKKDCIRLYTQCPVETEKKR